MPQKDLDNQSFQPIKAPDKVVSNPEGYIVPNENSAFQKALEWTLRLYKPEEFRSNVKLWGSGVLALSLWILLGFLAWSHFESSQKLAFKVSELKPQLEDGKISLVHQEKVQLLEKANNIVDSTSNRLYTFLTPIVTAITGYFFVSSSSKNHGRKGSQGGTDN